MSTKHCNAKNSLATHVQTFFQELKIIDCIWKQSTASRYLNNGPHDTIRPQIHWVCLFLPLNFYIFGNNCEFNAHSIYAMYHYRRFGRRGKFGYIIFRYDLWCEWLYNGVHITIKCSKTLFKCPYHSQWLHKMLWHEI